MDLYDHQKKALEELKPGSILCGGVGSGKSRTALAYYVTKECEGTLRINGNGCTGAMKSPKDLYIITTARKRDTLEWEGEAAYFLIGKNQKDNIGGVKMTVDSWNNIKKYKDVRGAFFIFDEQRVIGWGEWTKNFLRIAKNNRWILLSATPGDTWTDYIPVFVAHGYYKNKTDFIREHCVFSRFSKYPKIERYLGETKLRRLRASLLVEMPFERPTISHHEDLPVGYNKSQYMTVMRKRWDPYNNEPIEQASELCYVLRRIVNEDHHRVEKMKELLKEHPKAVVFYSFDYELDILKNLAKEMELPCAEWNGHRHEQIPKTDRWMYLVQYMAGSEGWNCIETDTLIFYSQTYSYKMMVQAAGRIDRLNTPFVNLYYYHLYSTSPIDLAIRRALKNKKNFNENRFFRV